MATSLVPARGSARSRAAAALSARTLRPLTAVVPPQHPWGLWFARRTVAQIMSVFGPPLSDTSVEPVDIALDDGRRVRGEWVRSGSIERDAAAIFFLHGSGYALCSPRTHRRLASWLSRSTGLPVYSVDYRLAPQHRFPAAADDVRAAWDWMTGVCRISAEDIMVVGDSAGGHLALDLLLQPGVAGSGVAGLVLMSPLVDPTMQLAAARERLRPDPVIRAADAARLVRLYTRGVDPAHARLALDLAGAASLPPTLIQAGGAEMLCGDAHFLHTAMTAAGLHCELQVWPDQVHVFQALPKLAPEARPAMAEIATFVRRRLQRTAVDETG